VSSVRKLVLGLVVPLFIIVVTAAATTTIIILGINVLEEQQTKYSQQKLLSQGE
jgi:hypothetical protein